MKTKYVTSWVVCCVLAVVVGFTFLSLQVAGYAQYERDMNNWADSLRFNQTLKVKRGFYKGCEFQVRTLKPIRLSGPVELILYRSKAYEMFREVEVERRNE